MIPIWIFIIESDTRVMHDDSWKYRKSWPMWLVILVYFVIPIVLGLAIGWLPFKLIDWGIITY